MDKEELEIILGRKEYDEFISLASTNLSQLLRGHQILVTGGNGSLGNALADWFDANRIDSYHLLDVNTENKYRRIHFCNIINYEDIRSWISTTKPTFIFHFAAAKHAPEGEVHPWETIKVNIDGTKNILDAIDELKLGTHLVLSSTCKAISPETCYGASKLIAERLVLNAGGSVARYFNVVQSSGNVFEIWDNSEEHLVTPCNRYFISLDEAIALTVNTAFRVGRYVLDPMNARYMPDICDDLYGDGILVDRRRGDRENEPAFGPADKIENVYGPLYQIVNYHD